MTPEQLEALLDFIEVQAIEAVYQVTSPESARPHEAKSVLRRVYEVFDIAPPPNRGLKPPESV
jgi:hypothetical protein